MCKRLMELIDRVVLKEGSKGRTRLALAIERGERMIDRYQKGLSVPSSNNAYKLAREAGGTDEEALEIAKECSSEMAKETA